VDLVDSSTQTLWLDEMTLIHSEFGKVFFMKVVGNHLICSPIKLQSIWITKILSSAVDGRGG
jgi:hypothetical protein